MVSVGGTPRAPVVEVARHQPRIEEVGQVTLCCWPADSNLLGELGRGHGLLLLAQRLKDCPDSRGRSTLRRAGQGSHQRVQPVNVFLRCLVQLGYRGVEGTVGGQLFRESLERERFDQVSERHPIAWRLGCCLRRGQQ